MNEEIKKLTQRIEALEKIVFGSSGDPADTAPIAKKSNYSGPLGGTRLLIVQDFFKAKRSLGEIRKELEKNGYHYSRQAVHNALSTLSKSGGSLVTLKNNSKNVYVERK